MVSAMKVKDWQSSQSEAARAAPQNRGPGKSSTRRKRVDFATKIDLEIDENADSFASSAEF